MNGIKLMNETVKSLLLEAELKDIFNSIKVDDILSIDLKDGRMFTYTVIENKSGNIKLRDRKPNETGFYAIFIISKDSMNDSIMTTWKFDSKQSDGKGEELKFDIKAIRTGKTGQNTQIIDIENPDLQREYEGYNNIIKSAEIGDEITISNASDSKDGGEELYNTVFLKVHEKKRNNLMVSLEDVDGNSETLNNYYINFNNKNLYINTNNLIRIKNNDSLTLTLAFKGRNNKVQNIHIDNIREVDLNKVGEDVNDDNGDDKNMSEKALQDMLDKNPIYQKMIDQQPGILDVIRGASAKGIYQLAKKMKNAKVNNSFLTVGKRVKFIWLSPTNYKNEKNVLKRGSRLEGLIERGPMIKYGDRATGIFELELIDETEPSTYTVKVTFTNVYKNISNEPNGLIKIIDNG